MDRLVRLTVALFLLACWCGAGAAGYAVYTSRGGGYTATGTTAQASCQSLVDQRYASVGGGSGAVPSGGGECDALNVNIPGSGSLNLYAGDTGRSCTDGTSTCTDAPQPHACGPAGSTIPHPNSEVSQMPDGTAPTAVCDNGCTAVPAHTATNNMGNSYSYGDTIGTGHSCGANAAAGGRGPSDPASGPAGTSAPDATPAPTDAAKCVQGGLCPGTVNGTTVCVACGSSGSGGASATTSTSATGQESTSVTTTSTSTTSSGTTSTTSTTTNSDGSSSTTTTAGAGGSSGGGGAGAGGGPCTGTDCGSGADSFGGSCTASFTCTGDAIQCAIAKEQHQRDCLTFQPETQPGPWADAAGKLTTAIQDGVTPAWSPAHPGNAITNNFDWANAIDRSSSLPAACPADVPIGSSGRVLPIAWLCPYFSVIGVMVEAFAVVVCLLILFKGK